MIWALLGLGALVAFVARSRSSNSGSVVTLAPVTITASPPSHTASPSMPHSVPTPPWTPASADAWFAGYWKWSPQGWVLQNHVSGVGVPQSNATTTWENAFVTPAPPYLYGAVFTADSKGRWNMLRETTNVYADGSPWLTAD